MAPSLPSTRDKQPSGDDYDSIINIKVGNDGGEMKKFEIHKGLLKFYSGYFLVAVKNVEEGRFAEGAEKMITLPEERVEIFEAFKTWLYTKCPPVRNSGGTASAKFLIDLWCFGDYREIPLLQNECIDSLVNLMRAENIIPIALLDHVYDNTTSESPLRRFFINSVAVKRGPTLFSGGREGYWTKEALVDLATLLLARPEKQSWAQIKLHVCEWHVHEEDVSCNP